MSKGDKSTRKTMMGIGTMKPFYAGEARESDGCLTTLGNLACGFDWEGTQFSKHHVMLLFEQPSSS